jgi:hypothetical protein
MHNHCPTSIKKEIVKLEEKVEAINIILNNGISKSEQEFMELISDRNNYNQTIAGKKKEIQLLKSSIRIYTPIFYSPPQTIY